MHKILQMNLFCFILIFGLNLFCIQHFDIIYVGSQKWGGGISTAGSGKNYKFTFKVNYSSKILQIRSVKIGTNCYPIKVFKDINSQNGEFEKNDTIHFQINIKSGNNNVVCIDTFPENYSNMNIVLKYQFKEKNYFKTIDSIKEEKPILYP